MDFHHERWKLSQILDIFEETYYQNLTIFLCKHYVCKFFIILSVCPIGDGGVGLRGGDACRPEGASQGSG